MGYLCRHAIQFGWLAWLYLPAFPPPLDWAPADRHDLLRHGPSHDAGPVSVDGGPQSPVAFRRHQRVLHVGAIFVDAGVAARAVSDALARHRYRIRLQCAALYCVPRPAVRGYADPAIRRLWEGGDDLVRHLRPGIRRRAVPAGNERKAAAGGRLNRVG